MNRHTFPSFLEKIWFFAGEMLFPRSCGVCGATKSFLCPSCFLALSNGRRQSQSCGHCGVRETPLGRLCFECAACAPHDGIFAALRYGDHRVARLIHLFKYRFIRDLGTPLGTLLASAVAHSELSLPDAIIPVPLHPRRERWRGWNQSEILADALAEHLPEDVRPPVVKNILIRTRFTSPQMSLRDKELRQKNIEGAFRVNQKDAASSAPFDPRGKRIWIVDDVAASGSTIAACAATLKERGAREVFGIVVAR